MSTSSASPDISIVIGSNGAAGSVERILTTLTPQVEGAEVIVCEPEPTPDDVRERFPFARFLLREDALVPELWRDGIAAARAPVVALTISPMEPAPDWVTVARRLGREVHVAGGAIEPAAGTRIRDVAEYFCRYSRDMLPFDPHECVELPGDNAVYTSAALEQSRPEHADGFWEAEVNLALRERGTRLLHTPDLLTYQGRSAGIGAFIGQRLRHGRLFGHQRGARFSPARNAAGVLATPLVPFLMTWRVIREAASRRRHGRKLVLALPLVFLFNAVWAGAEGFGHLQHLAGRRP